jgi:hypothetical protein
MVVACGFCLSACATKGENLLLNSYSAAEKSALLSDKGILLYNVMLEKDDILLVPDIKNLLQEALKLNPANEAANAYLQKADNYGSDIRDRCIILAKSNLLKNRGRTEDDDYNLCLTVQKAYQIDPANNEIIALRDATKAIREKLAGEILAYADDQVKLIKNIENKIKQGRTIIFVIEKLDKAFLLGSDLANQFGAQRADFANLLSANMDLIIAEVKKLMEKGKYHDAEIRFKILNKYNLYVKHKYDDDLKELQYNLYLAWSKNLRASNQTEPALEKINLALRTKKTREAQELQTGLQSTRNRSELAASFDARISEIDALLDQGEIALAYQKISALAALTKAPDKLRELKSRKAKVKALLEAVYSEAVTDFVNENYSSAVKGFQNTLVVTRHYKNAENYLKKAQSELKILELYQ